MNINKKILDNIEILKNTTFIEIAPKLYRDISDEVLEELDKRNIVVLINNKVKTLTFNAYKRDCFAYKKEGKCKALRQIDCVGCKFYRTDLKMEDIERDIVAYSQNL